MNPQLQQHLDTFAENDEDQDESLEENNKPNESNEALSKLDGNVIQSNIKSRPVDSVLNCFVDTIHHADILTVVKKFPVWFGLLMVIIILVHLFGLYPEGLAASTRSIETLVWIISAYVLGVGSTGEQSLFHHHRDCDPPENNGNPHNDVDRSQQPKRQQQQEYAARCQINELLGSIGAPPLECKDALQDVATTTITISTKDSSRATEFYHFLIHHVLKCYVEWFHVIDSSLESLRLATALSLGRTCVGTIKTIPLERLEVSAASHRRLARRYYDLPWNRLRKFLYQNLRQQLCNLEQIRDHVVAYCTFSPSPNNNNNNNNNTALDIDWQNTAFNANTAAEDRPVIITLAMLRSLREAVGDAISETLSTCCCVNNVRDATLVRSLMDEHFPKVLQQLDEAKAYMSSRVKDEGIHHERLDTEDGDSCPNSQWAALVSRDVCSVEETTRALRIALLSIRECYYDVSTSGNNDNDSHRERAKNAFESCRRVQEQLANQLDQLAVRYFDNHDDDEEGTHESRKNSPAEQHNGSITELRKEREEYISGGTRESESSVKVPHLASVSQQLDNPRATLVFAGTGMHKPSTTIRMKHLKQQRSKSDKMQSLLPLENFSPRDMLTELKSHLHSLPPTEEVEINTVMGNIDDETNQVDKGEAALQHDDEDASFPSEQPTLPQLAFQELASAIQLHNFNLKTDEEKVIEYE